MIYSFLTNIIDIRQNLLISIESIAHKSCSFVVLNSIFKIDSISNQIRALTVALTLLLFSDFINLLLLVSCLYFKIWVRIQSDKILLFKKFQCLIICIGNSVFYQELILPLFRACAWNILLFLIVKFISIFVYFIYVIF
jgi:hypothetical protein